ncbi:MAG: hypothetical protein ACFFDO_08555 [Candidatus Thorarchaeota archaeon]
MAKEISKWLKLWFLINSILGLIFTIIYLIILEIYWVMVDWPYFDPIFGRILGITLLTLTIMSVMAYRETDWENVKIFVEFSIIWLISLAIVNIWSVFVTQFSPTALASVAFDTTLLIVLAIGNIYFFIQHQK